MKDEIPGQTTIYDFIHGPGARATDPQSSHEAAAQADKRSTKVKVLQALHDLGFANDETIAYQAGVEKGPAARRRLDLQRAGLIQPVMVFDPVMGSYQYRSATRAGVLALVWQLSADGCKFIEEYHHAR